MSFRHSDAGPAPERRHFRQHIQASSRVFAAFGVVRGGCQHLERPAFEADTIAGVKLVWRTAESDGIAADLVERDQRVVPVEARVLDPLGLDRRR